MPPLTLVALGSLPDGLLDGLASFLEKATGLAVALSPGSIDPAFAYDRTRGQVDCRRVLPVLEEASRGSGGRVLGVADVDLYSAVFTFVFGEAKLGGAAGLFSIHRLRPGLYGLPDDPELLGDRARKEALHETGHLLGLVHCRDPECVMRFSGAAEEVDLKSAAFCGNCLSALSVRVRGEAAPGSPPPGPGNAPGRPGRA